MPVGSLLLLLLNGDLDGGRNCSLDGGGAAAVAAAIKSPIKSDDVDTYTIVLQERRPMSV